MDVLSCPLCLNKHFENVDSLRKTLIKVATSEITCPVCNEKFLGLDKLTIHLFSHVRQKEIVDNVQIKETFETTQKICEETEKKWQDSEEFEKKSQSTTEVQKKFLQTELDQINNENELLCCDICNFTFSDKNILEMHQKLLHQTCPDKKTGIYSYHCHLCSKKFKMRGSLMVHLRVAHLGFSRDGENRKLVEKSPPLSPLSGDQNLAEKNAKNDKQWSCEICAKMFTTKYFLKKHKRLHTGEMPYCCTQCNKSFTFQQSYHKHMLYHSSEKPHTCNECGRSFKELSTLQNHARIHSGERPFGCETCGKRFRQRVSYLVHRRIHTGVMPYKCTSCEKTFRYKVSQRSHKCTGTVFGTPESENGPQTNVQCIVSVDQSGNVRFIQQSDGNMVYVNENSEKLENTIPEDVERNRPKQDDVSGQVFIPNTATTDLYSMVMSPLLPDVETLSINSMPNEQETINTLFFNS